MAKGYWVVFADVHDDEGYKDYVALNAEAFAKYGAKFLVRGGNGEAMVGNPRGRTVVIEFESRQKAIDCFHSPEYQRALELRQKYSTSDQVIVDGYDGPQPGES